MNQFGNQDFIMDQNYNHFNTYYPTEHMMKINAVEDEATVMAMILTDPTVGFYDHDLIDISRQHHEQIISLKSAETPPWQPFEELASFPPYRPIAFAAPPPPRTSFIPSPTGPKFSYIPAPEPPPPPPRRAAVTEYGETSSTAGTLISVVSSALGTSTGRSGTHLKAAPAPAED